MQVQYDPTIIGVAAARLYARASSLALSYGVLGGLVGFVLGGVFGAAMSSGSDRSMGFLVVGGIIAIIGAIVGVLFGRERAFFLRLEAQRMLVLVQIEMNTRR